jgi:hypothetical protein
MRRSPKSRWLSRLVSATLAGVLAMVGVAISPARPALANAGPGWFMLVNDYYSNYQGNQYCLSTNAQQSNSGAGTHFVYLAVCNQNTPGQWWYYSATTQTTITNYQDFNNTVWQLSANGVTPTGGLPNTFGAYTAAKSSASTHLWEISTTGTAHEYYISNPNEHENELSATATSPELPGTLRVFTVAPSDAPTHVWRPWQPSGTPACGPCGAL